ncbi:fibronectin type III domain-containing protein [Anaerosacchariphilus polymeriproducens]|uniref:Fibronectin type-III domain-containing protein n=1 Tax=Anaerosacchariphilus polymeriproducens TaxID=1812858 RepID=A0A371AW43_9FIRM|nr:fibronectin type III domain-containing protein [Anaerosacchariphilus polymeriproducens]RDU23783.1 hypothetical protein DWV06_07965 [Anaerosacchariphilus polymeriproducens]
MKNLKETMVKKVSHFFAAAIMVCLLLGFNSMKVNAYYYYGDISNLRQTNATTNSATIQWTSDAETVKFNIYIRVNSSYQYKYFGSTQAKNYTFGNLADGTEYDIKVIGYSASGEEGDYEYTYVKTLPNTVKNLKQDKWYYFIKVLNVSWNRASGVDGYQVELKNSRGKIVKKLNYNSGYYDSASFSNMKDEIYTVHVRSYTKLNGKTYYSKWSTIFCFNQPRIKSVKVSGKKLKVSWGKVGGATGYDVYVSTKKTSGYKKVKSVGKNTTKATISKLKGKKFSAKKTYYVYVITKKKIGKRTYRSSSLYYWNNKNSSFGYK